MKNTTKGFTLWLTGLPCSGKSTLSEILARELERRGRSVEILDGDIIRTKLGKGLGYSKEDRDENIRRIGFVSELLSKHGAVAIVAAVSPYRAVRDEVRATIPNFIELHVDTPVEVCIQRDVKGMYKKALRGQLKNFTVVDDPYEPPLRPEVTIKTAHQTPNESAAHVLAYLEQSGFLEAPEQTDRKTASVQPRRDSAKPHGIKEQSKKTSSKRDIINDRFVIFSLSRCGSTTLMRSLNSHSSIRCALEPFNNAAPGHQTNYLERVRDEASLDAALEDIWRTYNGIKHVWHPLGWPFAENSDFNRLLMLRPGQRVLFLNRRNNLQRLVSAEISMQSGVWATLDDASRNRLLETEFKPLDIAKIKARLELDRRAVSQHRQRMVDSGIDFMELWYEDLFNPASRPEQTNNEFNRILAFLGRTAITDDETLAKVNSLWQPDRLKQSSEAVYRMIPGIEEVEEVCGSDATGWLFK